MLWTGKPDRSAGLAFLGSVLRDNFSPGSDIGVLVEFQPGAQVGFLALSRMHVEFCTSRSTSTSRWTGPLCGSLQHRTSPACEEKLPESLQRNTRTNRNPVEKMDDLFHQLTAALRSIPPPPAIERPTPRTRALQSIKTGQVGLTDLLR